MGRNVTVNIVYYYQETDFRGQWCVDLCPDIDGSIQERRNSSALEWS